MNQIKIKHRLFENVVEMEENVFSATYKGKKYTLLKFEPYTTDGDEICFSCKRIFSAGIKAPKLKWIDKKLGYIVREYVEGESVMDLIMKDNLSEEIYKQLFLNAYLAKMNGMTLNYEPDKWLFANGVLYYVYPHFIIYNEAKDLVKSYLRLWFITKELLQFASKLGLEFDKTRMKDEYTTNKEIVLMTCKYYK